MNEKYSCCNSDSVLTAMVPRPTEEKEIGSMENKMGMYNLSIDTLHNLQEIEDMLELFHREINAPANSEMKIERREPTSFKENIDMINIASYGIKRRLEDLIALFR